MPQRGSSVKQIIRNVAKRTLEYPLAVLRDFRFQPCVAPLRPSGIPTPYADRLSNIKPIEGGVPARMVFALSKSILPALCARQNIAALQQDEKRLPKNLTADAIAREKFNHTEISN
jgi:hypothetical protein